MNISRNVFGQKKWTKSFFSRRLIIILKKCYIQLKIESEGNQDSSNTLWKMEIYSNFVKKIVKFILLFLFQELFSNCQWSIRLDENIKFLNHFFKTLCPIRVVSETPRYPFSLLSRVHNYSTRSIRNIRRLKLRIFASQCSLFDLVWQLGKFYGE